MVWTPFGLPSAAVGAVGAPASLSRKWTTVLGIGADDHETWQPIGSVDFDLNDGAVEADDGAGVDFGEHEAKCTQPTGRWQMARASLKANDPPSVTFSCDLTGVGREDQIGRQNR